MAKEANTVRHHTAQRARGTSVQYITAYGAMPEGILFSTVLYIGCSQKLDGGNLHT